ncbi:MAG: ABC transporter substrate-binding protein [Anaerolineae bacterium]
MSSAVTRREVLKRLLAFGAGAAALAACQPMATPQVVKETEPAQQAPTAAQEPVTITYWSLENPEGEKRGFVEPFEQSHPGVKVDYQNVPWDAYIQKYQSLSAAGQAPDVAFVSIAWIYDWAKAGIVLNLRPYMELSFGSQEFDSREYYTQFISGLRYPDTKGDFYAVPYEWVTIVLYYNKDMFDEAGLAYPDPSWTYDDIVENALKLTKREGDAVVQFGMNSGWWYSVSDSSIHSNGGELLSSDYKKALVDSPQNVETYQWWVDLIAKHKVAPTPAEAGAEGGPSFTTGKVAMMIEGVWMIPSLRDQKAFNWDITVLPAGKVGRKVVAWPNSYCISSKSKQAELAWELILAALDPKRPPDTVGVGKVPIARKLAQDPVWLEPQLDPKNKKAILDTEPDAVNLTCGPRWNEWRDALDKELELAYIGEVAVAEAVTKANAAVQAVLDRP